MPDQKRGLLITFEGIDGSGKSTHLRLTAGWLEQQGLSYKIFAEPGGTEIGEQLRSILLDGEKELDPRTETLLFLAARAQLVATELLPQLAQGKIILLDRFTDSTIAYQGYGRGINLEVLQKLAGFAAAGLEPDLTFFLDLPPEQALARCKKETYSAGDRFESLSLDYFRKVREGYLNLAQNNPQRMKVLNSSLSLDNISGEIVKTIEVELIMAGYLLQKT